MNAQLAPGSWLDCVHCKTQCASLYYLVRGRPGRFAVTCLKCYEEKESAKAKFWALVEKGDGCWLWQGGLMADGYGYFSHPTINGLRAHRASWVINCGPLGANEHVLHHCDTPACVRPSHLFVGNHQDNMTDMKRKGRSSSIFTWESVRQLRADAATGVPTLDLMRKYGVKYSTVREVLTGKTWKEEDAPAR